MGMKVCKHSNGDVRCDDMDGTPNTAPAIVDCSYVGVGLALPLSGAASSTPTRSVPTALAAAVPFDSLRTNGWGGPGHDSPWGTFEVMTNACPGRRPFDSFHRFAWSPHPALSPKGRGGSSGGQSPEGTCEDLKWSSFDGLRTGVIPKAVMLSSC